MKRYFCELSLLFSEYLVSAILIFNYTYQLIFSCRVNQAGGGSMNEYAGSNLLPISRFLAMTHTNQAFRLGCLNNNEGVPIWDFKVYLL